MEGLQSLRLKDALYSQLVFQRNHFITKYMEIKIFIQQFEESLDEASADSDDNEADEELCTSSSPRLSHFASYSVTPDGPISEWSSSTPIISPSAVENCWTFVY